jgi:hypothetical protein
VSIRNGSERAGCTGVGEGCLEGRGPGLWTGKRDLHTGDSGGLRGRDQCPCFEVTLQTQGHRRESCSISDIPWFDELLMPRLSVSTSHLHFTFLYHIRAFAVLCILSTSTMLLDHPTDMA